MRHLRFFHMAVFAVLLAISLHAADLPSCAVMTFEAKGGISKDESAIIADGLESELIDIKRYRIVSRANLARILEVQKFSLECAGTECAIEAGKLAAIHYVVFGIVGKVGETYSLVANLVNVETGVIEKTARVTQSGKVDQLLINGVSQASRKLMGLSADAQPGPASPTVAERPPPPASPSPAIQPLPAVEPRLGQAKWRLVYLRLDDVWSIAPDGTDERQVTHLGNVQGTPRLSDNGVLLYCQNDSLFIAAADGSSPRRLSHAGPPARHGGDASPDISPDGTRVAYVGPSPNLDLLIASVDGSAPQSINHSGLHQCYPNWGRDGFIYFGQCPVGNPYGQCIYRIPENGGNTELITQPFSQYPSPGPKQVIAHLYNQRAPKLRLLDLNTGGSRYIETPHSGITWSAFAPDGNTIYYVWKGNIWSVHTATGASKQLTTHGEVAFAVDIGAIP